MSPLWSRTKRRGLVVADLPEVPGHMAKKAYPKAFEISGARPGPSNATGECHAQRRDEPYGSGGFDDVSLRSSFSFGGVWRQVSRFLRPKLDLETFSKVMQESRLVMTSKVHMAQCQEALAQWSAKDQVKTNLGF